MLIYTSGTTGKPKGAVHVHCGFPIKGAQDMAHLFDVQEDDTLFWLTDMGWMMGPWAISGTLMLGATLVIYEGTPDYPGPDRLWALVERHGVTVMGVSPTVIRSLMAHGDEPVRQPRPEQAARPRRDAASRGTRALALVLRGRRRRDAARSSTTPAAPRSPAASSAARRSRRSSPAPSRGRSPAWRPTWWTTQGNPVRGQVGELVIRQPWPGMTRGFWHDPERYVDAYWVAFPASGYTATGRRSIATASGTSWAAPTTRSRWRASASARRRSSRRRSRIRR